MNLLLTREGTIVTDNAASLTLYCVHNVVGYAEERDTYVSIYHVWATTPQEAIDAVGYHEGKDADEITYWENQGNSLVAFPIRTEN